MPRGRPRKPRLRRIDAAVDAMAQLGFPSEKVKKVVKQLLEEYGGNDGWQFIEDCAYMELINAILREVYEDNVADGDNNNGGNQSMDMSVEDEGAASGTSNAVTQQAVASCLEVVICSPRIHNEVGESVIIPSPEEGNAWKDIVQDQTSEQVVMEADKNKHESNNVPIPKTQPSQKDNETPVSPLLAILPPPPPRNTCPALRRTPCYGWIDSDDEEVPKKFIFLTPAREVVEKKSIFWDGTERKLKHKSRWDQQP